MILFRDSNQRTATRARWTNWGLCFAVGFFACLLLSYAADRIAAALPFVGSLQ